MKICPNCSAAFDDTPKYCIHCGTKLPEPAQGPLLVTEQGVQEESVQPASSPDMDMPASETEFSTPAAELSPSAAALPAPAASSSVSEVSHPVPSEEQVRQTRKSVWKFVSLMAIASVLVLTFVWAISLIHNLLQRVEVRVKDSVVIMESDNDELVGVSESGRLVKLKTDSTLAAPKSGAPLYLKSADGSLCAFLDSQKVLRLFDGSRFTTVAEDVQDYAISFDGSALAYTNADNDLFWYRKGKVQAVASRVLSGSFCLSPKGDALAYVREDGSSTTACFFNGKERTIAKEAVPFAISNGATYVYYYTYSKGTAYVQKGGNIDSRQKISDLAGEYCLDVSGEQILIHDGTNTYYSEYGGERVKIASVPLTLLAPSGVAKSLNGIYGIKNLKDRFYTTLHSEGYQVYHLSDRLELSSLIKNIADFDLQKDGRTLLYTKNQNLYYIDLRKAEKGEKKVAGNIKGYRSSGDGKHVLYVDDELESWFVTLGKEPKRVTADTINTSQVVPLESGFVYEMEGSLYYTTGSKGTKISGLSDDVLSLGGDRFVVLVECGNGDVFISTNGKKYTKYIRK